MHPDTFNATVNTAIVLAQQGAAPPDHALQVADFTNVSIHTDYARFSYLLRQTEGTGFAHRLAVSNPQYAIYHYRQSLIRSNTNKPFFAASPKLFELLIDTNNSTTSNNIDAPSITYNHRINNKTVELYKLGDQYAGMGAGRRWLNVGLCQIVSGIKTGDNKKYLRIADGRQQKSLLPVNNLDILSETSIESLSLTEKTKGVNLANAYVSFEMGLPSDADEGFLPSYHQEKSKYFINWSVSSVAGMKAETSSDLANEHYRFLDLGRQISFSFAGQYSPTFRESVAPIFLNAAPRIVLRNGNQKNNYLALLNSKLVKYFSRNLINHTVNFGVDDIKDIHAPLQIATIGDLTNSIIQKQQTNPRYDYASNEQLDIDRLVYAAYGLNDDDIREVEHWFARRYPKLAGAQRQALVAAGKTPQLSTQVLHWYGDESRHLPYDRAPIMLLGGLACPADKVATAHAELAALWAAHGLPAHFEAKWTKVSPAKLDFYLALVDWFFTSEALSEHLSLRVLVVPDKQAVFAKLPATTQDMAYYRLYYYLLHGVMAPQTQLRVFIDIKDTRGRSKTAQLLQSLQDDAGEAAMMGDVQEVHSHEVRLLQVADLLIGAIGYARIQAQGEGAALVNGAAVAVDKTMFSKPSKSGAVEQVLSSPAKRALISRIEQHLAHPLSLDTPPGNPRMTVLSWYDMDALTA